MLSIYDWILFHMIAGLLLVIDLSAHKKDHVQTFKESLLWSVVWIAAGVIFIIYIHTRLGVNAALEYGTAYTIEKMLSIDNLFVFAVIFTYFSIDKKYEHKILFYGIVGAIIFRGLFIFLGYQLLEYFHFMIYIFGLALIYTGIRLLKERTPKDPSHNPVIRYVKKVLLVSEKHNGKFIVRIDNKVAITPLFITLLAIETTDILFAMDSVPAVLAVTKDVYVAYTSNIFAVLGLRSLYFLLINTLNKLRYLNVGLFILLIYLGIKIMISDFIQIPTYLSLIIVGIILIVTSLLSLRAKTN